MQEIIDIIFKRKKEKKESLNISRRCYKPKGNGINPCIHTDELLDAACAGYIAEYMY